MARPANSYRNRAAARAKAYQSVQVVNTKTDTPVPESTGGISTRNIITNSVGLGEGIGVGLGDKLGRGNLSRVNKPNTETEGAKAADKTGTDVKELTPEQIAARERDTALTDERTHRVSEASQQLLDYQAWLNSPEGKAAEERRQTRKHGSENMNDASAVININRFKAQPNRGSGKRRERTSWVEIQDALDNKIMPNELYIQGDKGFVSTAYNITLFMLPEGKLIGQRLGKILADIKSIKDVENAGSVIVAQSAGTDEYYIESVEFESVLALSPRSTSSVTATNVDLVIRSPFQADLIDNILKAAIALETTNQHDIPIFMLIEWKARDDVTSAPVTDLGVSRCLALRFMAIQQTYDESGSTYSIEAISYSEHNFNSIIGSLQEDVKVGGKKVGEILAMVCFEMSRQQTKASDTVLVPDVYAIELEGDMGELPLVIGLQEYLSSVRALPNYYEVTKLESKIGNAREPNDEQTTDTSTKIAEISQKHDQESKIEQTATFKAGTDIPTIIRNIIAGTVEFQRLISDVPAPEGDDAQQVKPTVNPANVERYFIKIDSETELLGYDPNRRRYAAKRIYRVHKNLNPRFSYSETNTQQDKVTSMDRLHGLLGFDMVKKAYHYYYTGLNTEVKGVDFKFDNAWFVAKGLYSKLVDSYKRDHGTNAKDDVHKGSVWVNELRENHDLRTEKQSENLMAVSKAKKAEERMTNTGGIDKAVALRAAQKNRALQAKNEAEIAKSKEDSLEAKKKILAMLNQTGDLTEEWMPPTEVSITADGKYFVQYNVPISYQRGATKQYTGQVYLNDLDLAGDKFKSVLFPVAYTDTRLAKTMQDGLRDEYDRGRNIIAEIYQQAASGDMISLELEIRGDSWWIPNSPGDNADTSISPNKKESYMILIADQGEQWEPNTGLMTINDRNSLNGVYCVITVKNSFQGGEFNQTLNCVRDPTIDLNLVLSEPKKFREAMDAHNREIDEAETLHMGE